MPTPAAKRRRVGAASALHKPFKSPFRTPLKQTPESEASTSSAETAADPTCASITYPQRTPTSNRNPTYTTPASNSARSNNTLRPNTSATALVALRAEIQTLTQAISLAATTTDADLEVLIERWRTASRAAAEELFAKTRDRVNRMGGVGAWRERERDQRDRMVKWEREEREAEMKQAREMAKAAREEDGDGREVEMERDYGEGDREEENTREGEGGRQDDVADDDSFTMDIMLKTLNIDLDIIGYDKVGQRWVG